MNSLLHCSLSLTPYPNSWTSFGRHNFCIYIHVYNIIYIIIFILLSCPFVSPQPPLSHWEQLPTPAGQNLIHPLMFSDFVEENT
jgi:hypothetical protein